MESLNKGSCNVGEHGVDSGDSGGTGKDGELSAGAGAGEGEDGHRMLRADLPMRYTSPPSLDIRARETRDRRRREERQVRMDSTHASTNI